MQQDRKNFNQPWSQEPHLVAVFYYLNDLAMLQLVDCQSILLFDGLLLVWVTTLFQIKQFLTFQEHSISFRNCGTHPWYCICDDLIQHPSHALLLGVVLTHVIAQLLA